MPGESELDRMTAEWRARVEARLEKLGIEQHGILTNLFEIKANMIGSTEMEQLQNRVRALEDFKLKTVTILLCIQLVLMASWAVVSKLLSK